VRNQRRIRHGVGRTVGIYELAALVVHRIRPHCKFLEIGCTGKFQEKAALSDPSVDKSLTVRNQE
jgi:hypothetical protein